MHLVTVVTAFILSHPALAANSCAAGGCRDSWKKMSTCSIGIVFFLLSLLKKLKIYVQRGTKRYVNLAKQDPGKATQSS